MAAISSLRKLRYFVILFTTLNLIFTATCTVLKSQLDPHAYLYFENIYNAANVIAFFSSIYAIKGKPFLHRYFRTLLILLVAIVILSFDFIFTFFSEDNKYRTDVFTCTRLKKICYLSSTSTYFSCATGYILVIEIIWTLKAGPLFPHPIENTDESSDKIQETESDLHTLDIGLHDFIQLESHKIELLDDAVPTSPPDHPHQPRAPQQQQQLEQQPQQT